ncbi:thioredoxin family protein [Arcanobacterium phocae]|uniref:thioredoxin family protein n=1 Tax=Arcanobacterium phocae TaxID=131112 RepID=UPI001C0F233A|nr:thioredoxin family protein [Arcanobacterium phocae]
MDEHQSTVVLRYFHAPWSLPCVQMNRIFSEVAVDCARYIQKNLPESLGTSFEKDIVNIDDDPDLMATHGIDHVPTIQLSIQGYDVLTLTGARPKLALRSEIFSALNTHDLSSRAQRSNHGS